MWREGVEAEIGRLKYATDNLVDVDHTDEFAVGQANEIAFMRREAQPGQVLSIPLAIVGRRHESAVEQMAPVDRLEKRPRVTEGRLLKVDRR